jgi:hypothetical protein
MSDSKDYFGTFLRVLSSGATEMPDVSRPARAAAEPDPMDLAVRILSASGGSAPLDALVSAFRSLSAVTRTVERLQTYGLVEVDGGKVHLTEAGRSVASKLPAVAGSN